MGTDRPVCHDAAGCCLLPARTFLPSVGPSTAVPCAGHGGPDGRAFLPVENARAASKCPATRGALRHEQPYDSPERKEKTISSSIRAVFDMERPSYNPRQRTRRRSAVVARHSSQTEWILRTADHHRFEIKPATDSNMLQPLPITLDDTPLTLERLDPLLGRSLHVTIDPKLLQRIERSGETVARLARGSRPAYGINTGFGRLCTRRIPPDQVKQLQRNLLQSHAVGVGPPAPPELVRLMLLFKLKALSHGVSGVARATVEAMARLLNADLLPRVPTQGSLGASGDLAPLAHLVLPLLGEGEVQSGHDTLTGQEALARCGLQPLTLGPKEGLALINGTQFMTAYAAATVIRARRLAKHADLIATMSLEGIKGSLVPFDERLHRLRPHAGA
ncbi:MAG: hypothetical protein D6788_05155, partial [Planctomycetota bacterium]